MKESSNRVEDFMLETTRGCLSAAGWEAVPGLGQVLRAQLFARKSGELKGIHRTMGIGRRLRYWKPLEARFLTMPVAKLIAIQISLENKWEMR